MTVLERFSTDEYGTVELGYNGTSIEMVYTDDDGDLHNLMVRPETLIDILEENPQRVGKETMKHPDNR